MHYRQSRKYTSALLDLMDEGVISSELVAEMALQYMSEADVEDMMADNDLLQLVEEQ